MKDKKYLPSVLIMYLNYFIHGVGCSVLGQAVIKESLATSWGCDPMSITKISAALGLGRLVLLRVHYRINWDVKFLCLLVD